MPTEAAGAFPFATGAGVAFRDNQTWLGGCIRIIPATAATANLAIAHVLRSKPRFVWVLDVGTNTAFPTPPARGSTTWTFANVYLNWPVTTQPVTLLIA